MVINLTTLPLPPPPPTTSAGQFKEKICGMRTIVHRLAVDEMSVRNFVEKEKTGFYAKLGVFKPKPEEVVCEAVSLYYEQYVTARANYTIDYYRRKVYPIRVEDTVKEVIIFDKTLQPSGQEKGKQISLEAKERVTTKIPAYLCLDKSGKEIDPKKLPTGVEEPDSQRVLKDLGNKLRSPAANPDTVVGIIRGRIVKRPQDIERIVDEMFEVTELSAIYTPIYEARLRHLKTGVIKVVPVSGITGKLYAV
jgi:hypothetical protein